MSLFAALEARSTMAEISRSTSDLHLLSSGSPSDGIMK